MTQTENGVRRVLIDPNRMADGCRMDWYYPSPDGKFVAFGISGFGDEQSVLQIVETHSGIVLPEKLPNAALTVVAWCPDSTGFYYSAGKGSELEEFKKWIFFHRLGETKIRPPEDKAFGFDWVAPQLSDNGRYLMVLGDEVFTRALYSKDLIKGGDWKRILPEHAKPDDALYGMFQDDTYLALTTYKASRGRIVSIPLATVSDESTWREVVPESDAVLRSFVKVGDRIVIGELYNACAQLRIVGITGQHEKEIPLPGFGLIEGMLLPSLTPVFSVSDQKVYFNYQTFTEPLRTFCYNLDTDVLDSLGCEPDVDLSHFQTKQVFFPARDGTPLSMFMIHREDVDLSQKNPTVIFAYGGYGVVMFPSYWYFWAFIPFVQAGGVLAFPNIRGGGEYGHNWWKDGTMAAKQNSHDDLYTAAEYLIENGHTSRDILGMSGNSNGGLLAAIAVTQRPDLFKAILPKVPLTDLFKGMNDPQSAYMAATGKLEYGDPADSRIRDVILSYNPVSNVKEGQQYPATLIHATGKDMRCPAWHARKLTAMLQHANTSENPVLLQVKQEVGHGLSEPMDYHIDYFTTAVGFFMQQLGMRMSKTQVSVKEKL